MLSPKIMQLLSEIEQLSLEQQENLADALALEIADAKQGIPSIQELIAELDADIANGEIYDLDELEKLA
jgi:hypothetical protein